MAPARAVAALKERLITQYGSSTRDVVEAEVEGRLAGKTRVQREDIDALEQSIMGALRQRRSGNSSSINMPTKRQQRSQPQLSSLPVVESSSSSAAVKPPSGGNPALQKAPAPPAQQPGYPKPIRPKYPVIQLSASAPKLRPAPYGSTLGDSDAKSDRSCVKVYPRYAIPPRPKLKPMDHWDMIVAFDAAKHMEEEEHFEREGRDAVTARFRAVLDAQMEEVREMRDQQAADKQKEIDDMKAQIEENKRIKQAEDDREEEKIQIQKKANDEMTGKLEERRERERQRKQKEQDDVLNWMKNEAARQEQERKDNAEEFARKCAKAKKEMDEALAAAEARKAARKAQEKMEVKAAQKAMDDAEGKGRQAVKDRMDRLDSIAKTFGAALAERNAREEAHQAAVLKKVQEDGERMSREDAERRKAEHERKVKDMLAVRAKQVEDNGKQAIIDAEAGRRQAQIFKEQLEEGLAKDEAKRQRAKKNRADQDEYLIKQMTKEICTHPLQFGITDHTMTQDIAMNREIFEQMHHEGFEPEMTAKFLKYKTDKGRSGKLDPHPSVAVSDAVIHPLEQHAPDV